MVLECYKKSKDFVDAVMEVTKFEIVTFLQMVVDDIKVVETKSRMFLHLDLLLLSLLYSQSL